MGAARLGFHRHALDGVEAWRLAESVLDGHVGNVLVSTSLLLPYCRGSQDHAVRLAQERNERQLRPPVTGMEERSSSLGVQDRPWT